MNCHHAKHLEGPFIRSGKIGKLRYFLIVFAICVLQTGNASAQKCSMENVLDYSVSMKVASIEASGMDNEQDGQSYMLLASDEALERLPNYCRRELLEPKRQNPGCENLNRAAWNNVNSELSFAYAELLLNNDIGAFREKLYPIVKYVLSSTPRECWFQGVADQAPGPQSGSQCDALWAGYNECKRRVETALKKCAVTPGPCRDRGPTCIAPTCSR